MQKNLRDMVASKNIGLSEGPMVASGGAAVTPVPEEAFDQGESERLKQMLNSPEPTEPQLDSINTPTSPLREYFVEPNGKEKLKNAELRLKQALNLGQPKAEMPENPQMIQEV